MNSPPQSIIRDKVTIEKYVEFDLFIFKLT